MALNKLTSVEIDRRLAALPMAQITPAGLFDAIVEIIRRRWIPIAISFGLVFAAGVTAFFLMTPQYDGVATIKIDPSRDSVLSSTDDSSKSVTPDQSLIDTEVQLIQSSATSDQVVEDLKLYRYGGLGEALRSHTGQPGQTLDQIKQNISRALRSQLKVERQRGTYLVQVTYTSPDPQAAAAISNAFANAYINKALKSRSSNADEQSEFVNKRLKSVEDDLSVTDREVAEYRAKAGMLGSGNGGNGLSGTVVDQQVTPLTAQLASAEAAAAGSRARLESANREMSSGGILSLSSVITSSLVTSLRMQQAEIERGLHDPDKQYGPNHPVIIRQQEQLAQVEHQIESEARRIYDSMKSDVRAADAQVQSLKEQMASLRAQQADTTRASVMANTLGFQAEAKRSTFNQLNDQRQRLDQLARYKGIQIQFVELAAVPGSPSKPNALLFFAASVIAAGGAAFAVVVFLELLSKGIRSPKQMQELLGLPFLAAVPLLKDRKGARGGSSPADIIIDQPVSPFAEAFRSARSTLLLGAPSKSPKIISMMSTVPDEGKTTSSLAMARVLATSGERVLLIDCDLRQNGLSRLTGAARGPGLLELLSGRATFDQVVRKDRAANLDIIAIPEAVYTPKDVFSGGAMGDLLKQLIQSNRYDRIVLDTPPVLGVSDARVLAALSDAAILLVRWNSTQVNAIKSGIERLEADGAPLVGGMFTMVDPRSEAIGATYYSKKYEKYYQQPA
jgi:capsular exopolysaccharide synthesis family protein